MKLALVNGCLLLVVLLIQIESIAGQTCFESVCRGLYTSRTYCCNSGSCCTYTEKYGSAVISFLSLSIGAIIGIVIGGIFLLVLCIIGCVCCCCRPGSSRRNQGQVISPVNATVVTTTTAQQPVMTQQYPPGVYASPPGYANPQNPPYNPNEYPTKDQYSAAPPPYPDQQQQPQQQPQPYYAPQ